jgi:DNA polymerase IV
VAAHCTLLEKASTDEAYLAPTLAELAPYLAPAALAALQALPGTAKQQQQQQQPVADELAEALLGAGAAFALHIQSALRDSLQYQCSVGVAENKLLAKLATAEAKPAGVFALQRRRVTPFLNETPATALPGCGPDSATGAAFTKAGVLCIADLQRADVESIVRQAEAGVSGFDCTSDLITQLQLFLSATRVRCSCFRSLQTAVSEQYTQHAQRTS